MAFSFGAPAAQTSNTSATPQPAAGTTSLFGGFGSNTQNTGQTAQPASAPIGGGSFGSNTAQANNTPNTGFGLFNKPAGGQTGTASTTSLFGSTNANQAASGTTTSLFGNAGLQNAAPAAGTTGTSLFGGFGGNQQQQQQQQQPGQAPGAAPSFGGLGAGTTGSTSLFGANNGGGQNMTGAGTTSLFGQPAQQQQQQQQPSSGLNTSLFGNNQSQQQPLQNGLGSSLLNTSTFGNNANNNNNTNNTGMGSSLFGNGSMLGGNAVNGGAAANVAGRKRTLQERLQLAAQGVIKGQDGYKLRAYVYNAVPVQQPGQLEHVWPGPQHMPLELFNDAQRHNPDRKNLLPVELKGNEDLQQRVQVQNNTREHQKPYIDAVTKQITLAYQDINNTLASIYESNQSKIHTLKSHLIRWVSSFIYLVRLIRGTDISDAEEKTYAMLRDIERAYDAAGNGGRMDGRLGEFWAVIARFRVAFENGGLRSGGRFDWDAWAEQELTKIFRDQGKALQAMTGIVRDEKFDIKTIEDGFTKVL